MNKTQDFIKSLAKKYNLDVRVVNEIVNHPLLFTKSIMASNDLTPIRIRHLGAFIPRININSKFIYCDRNVRTMLLSEEARLATSKVLDVDIILVEDMLLELLKNDKFIEISDIYTRFTKVIKNLVKAPKHNKIKNSSIN